MPTPPRPISAPNPGPTALLADDEPHLNRVLQDRLRELWPALRVVAIASNGQEAATLIAQLQPDIAFLDIQMPGLTGLEVAQGIEGATRVVFVTAYDQHALEAFEQEALDYVLKPVRPERLQRTVERLQRALAPDAASPPEDQLARLLSQLLPASAAAAARPGPPLRHLRASQGACTHLIPVEDILFCQADDKYTAVRTARAEYLIRTSISELLSQLDPAHFWQVHRATLINVDQLLCTRRDANGKLLLRMKGLTQELAVSRAYVHLFRAM
ncbi:LytTR family DNA-binding domain-containing protein [Pelomonas sp. APW6]|uniref:LytTR family DNA-binding domain-containing protein n=1 Tax=Roseateles subflavus TaxID=3053353 RepID=A0ABT7LNT1_9BURK|nr:LytTR family DNA-binding domain-containing protein [Pelomonas sp. APW6]MDL5034537.1 LytTR family DNA-binding domain-containing protein [Pelomonas sp. APW6]